MATTFLQMESLLREEANKDDTLDALLPTKLRAAVRWIEHNYSWKYMDAVQTLTPSLWVEYPYEIELISLDETKRFDTVRFLTEGADGSVEFTDLVSAELMQLQFQFAGTPCHYALIGKTKLRLDRVPQEAFTLEFLGPVYTVLDADSDECWLFDNAPMLVIARAMIDLAPTLRSPEIRDLYRPMFDEHLRVAQVADEEYRYGNTSNVMGMG